MSTQFEYKGRKVVVSYQLHFYAIMIDGSFVPDTCEYQVTAITKAKQLIDAEEGK